MRHLLNLSLALGVLFVSQPASALGAANVDAISRAVDGCMQATDVKGVDGVKLNEMGWATAEMSKKGKKIDSKLTFFGSSEPSATGVLLMALSGEPICTVTGKVHKKFKKEDLIQQLNQLQDGSKPFKNEGDYYWIGKKFIMQMSSTGSKSEPAVRVIVKAQDKEK